MGISSSACSRCGEEQSQCSKSAEAVTVGRARVARGAVLSCAPFLARSLPALSLSLSLSLSPLVTAGARAGGGIPLYLPLGHGRSSGRRRARPTPRGARRRPRAEAWRGGGPEHRCARQQIRRWLRWRARGGGQPGARGGVRHGRELRAVPC